MPINIDELEIIRDSSDANVSPIIKVTLNGKMYNLDEDNWTTDEDGDLIFKLDEIKR